MNPATQSYIQEATAILEGLDETLLELEADPRDPKKVDAVFRALHTLKGSGAMFDFTGLAGFLHHFENAFDRIREGKASVTPELIQLSLASRDHMERMLATGPDADGGQAADPATAELVMKIETRLKTSDAPSAIPAPATERFVITFKPDPSALKNGMRPDLLLAELEGLGEAVVTCHGGDVPPLREPDPAVCHLSWRIELVTGAGREAVDDVFIFASDREREIVADAPAQATTPPPRFPP